MNAEEAVQAARASFPIYCSLVHTTDRGDPAEFADHHYTMADGMTDPEHPKVLIIMPRDSAKTTLVQWWLEWTLGRASLTGNKNWANQIRIIYIRHAATKAFDISNAIKDTIEANQVFRLVFPSVLPHANKWSQEAWKVKGNAAKDPTFVAAGIDSPPLGSRGDIIVLDDIADEKNMATKPQRQKVRDTLDNSIKYMLTPGGQITMICTRWAYDDPAAWAMERGYYKIEQKALTQDNKGEWVSWWPERKSVEELLQEREEDPRSFAKQRQNEVTPEEGLVFEKMWFTRRYDFFPAEFVWRYESWDLAQTTNKKSDWSVGLPFNIAKNCPLCPGGYWHYFIGPTMFRGKREYGSLKMAMKQVYDLLGGPSNNHYMLIEKKNAGESIAGEGLGPHYNLKFVGARGEGRGGPAKREADLRDILEICRRGDVHFPTDEYLRRTHERRDGQDADWLETLERALYSFDGSFEGHTDDVVITVLQGLIEGDWRKREQQKMIARPAANVPWARPKQLTRVHT